MTLPTPKRALVTLANGAQAEAVKLQANALTLVSPVAFAPGQPLRFAIAHQGAESEIQGKTIGCRRTADQSFEVQLRLVNLRRRQRQLLTSLLG